MIGDLNVRTNCFPDYTTFDLNTYSYIDDVYMDNSMNDNQILTILLWEQDIAQW